MEAVKNAFWTIVLSMGIIAAAAIVIMILEFIASVIPAWVALIIVALIPIAMFIVLYNIVSDVRNNR